MFLGNRSGELSTVRNFTTAELELHCVAYRFTRETELNPCYSNPLGSLTREVLGCIRLLDTTEQEVLGGRGGGNRGQTGRGRVRDSAPHLRMTK